MKPVVLSILLFISFFIFAAPVFAQKPDMQNFKTLPILHEGRIKPLGSFAQVLLKKISGKTQLGDMSAEEWLALSLFDPAAAAHLEIFALGHKDLQKTLNLSADKKLYSLAELNPGLSATLSQAQELVKRTDETFSAPQTALLTLHEHALLYTEILRSLSAVLPLDLTLPDQYKKTHGGAPLNYLALSGLTGTLDQELKTIIKKKGADPKNYSQNQIKTAEMSFRLNQIREAGSGSTILRVIPGHWNSGAIEWFSPWDLMLQGAGSPAGVQLIENWSALAQAYRAGDPEQWATALSTLSNTTFAQAQSSASKARLNSELLYRGLKPYLWMIGFYSAALLAAIFLYKRTTASAFLIPLSIGGAGLVLHGTSMLARIYILGRPPVGTLYESVLFVSLICAAIGIGMSLRRKNTLALIAGLAAAAALLLIAPIALPSGDNLEVLVAVLNTNFWLATHVLCITAGYGLCILTACLAHIALMMKELSHKLYKNIYHLSLSALLFMAVGTVLGGIWADQSWGRFWGWDPKENGALLICLWLIWVQHGRLSGKLNPAAFMAMLAALNIIVALSWFGVNLLNVGLHSYGFTAGMATGLGIFCAVQTALIAGLWLLKYRREKEKNRHAP
jgi:ABC-type transport system involved in cytochrome c biogenesis permease subunit